MCCFQTYYENHYGFQAWNRFHSGVPLQAKPARPLVADSYQDWQECCCMPKSLEPVAFDWKLMHMYRGETFNASRFWRHWLSRNFETDVVYSYLNSCIICQSRISCSWFAPAVPLSLRSVALEVFLGWICKAQARIHHWRTAYLILMMPCHDSWHLTTLRNGNMLLLFDYYM